MIIHLRIPRLGTNVACLPQDYDTCLATVSRSVANCPDCLAVAIPVVDLFHLKQLAFHKRCCFNRDIRRHQPASWLINLSGHQLHRLFTNRILTEYHKK